MSIAKTDIIWQEDGTPRSRQFDDVYFSARDGLAETRHVFLNGIGAPEVWQGAADFTIAETGFGTGLNFLAAWNLWRETAPASARLHYISAEAWPMGRGDMTRALDRWPDLATERDALIAAYPLRRPGFHHLVLDGGRVRLTLLFGEAATMFGQLDATVDAWFLDGFAPSRNPEMWRPALFHEVARLSKPSARIATFTVAGVVRRGLADVGFEVEKVPGFGTKKQCLTGIYQGHSEPDHAAPWFAPPVPARLSHVAVIGAGIAGLVVARALGLRGIKVTVIDRAAEPLAEASGNPAAVVEPQVARGGAGRALHEAAFLYARRFYEGLGPDYYRACGTLHQAGDEDAVVRFQQIIEGDDAPDPLFTSERWTDGSDALLIPMAGIVEPPRLRRALAEGLDLRLDVEVTGVRQAAGGWTVQMDQGSLTVDAVVIAGGTGSAAFVHDPALPMTARRGQISLIPPVDGISVQDINHVMSYGGYLTPAVEGTNGRFHVLGATFDAADPTDEGWRAVTAASHGENRDKFLNALPDLAMPNVKEWQGRTGLRATTPDRLPVAGGVVDEPQFLEAFAALRTGAKGVDFPPVPYQSGLYVLTGLGSRGFATAPLLGELIAAEMTGTPAPLPHDLREAIHPARFLVRALRKREL